MVRDLIDKLNKCDPEAEVYSKTLFDGRIDLVEEGADMVLSDGSSYPTVWIRYWTEAYEDQYRSIKHERVTS